MQIKTEFFSQSKVIGLFNKTFLQPIKVAMMHSKFADMSVFTKVFSAIAGLGLTARWALRPGICTFLMAL